MTDHGRLRLPVTVPPPDWNETATAYERDSINYSTFEERVRETPEAVALDVGRRTLTYCELDDQARGVAQRLRPLLDGVHQCVGVLAPGFFDAVVTLLADLRAVAAYVLLEATYPSNGARTSSRSRRLVRCSLSSYATGWRPG